MVEMRLKSRTEKRRLIILILVGLTAILFTSAVAYGVEYQNIYTDYQKFYSHFSPAGKHTDTESYKYNPSLTLEQNLDRRHANCNDCHDPHSATRSSSPLGSYFGAGTQANVSGVKVTVWDSNLTVDSDSPTNGNPADDNKFAFVSSVVKEYELCFKCHTRYSFDFQLYKNTYGRDLQFNWTKRRYYLPGDPGTDIIVPESDLTVEFNPNNPSFHPVVAHGQTAGTQNLPWADNRVFNETFMPGLSADSRIKCTDCHGSDTTNVRGPHGSTNKYILKKRAPTEEPTVSRTGYDLGSIIVNPSSQPYNMTWYVRTEDLICYNCHDMRYFGPGRGHPSRAKHWQNCQWHRPIALDQVGCASCKVTPIHGSATNRYMMLLKPKRGEPNNLSWCYNCHDYVPGQVGGYEGGHPSCPRFYSEADDGSEVEETRVHFQSARRSEESEYFVPLPTPDMPTLKGLGTEAAYRHETREDDYILFKEGKPKDENGFYKIRFDQPSLGDRPDGVPVGEEGYEDSISLWTIDHKKGTQPYLTNDGGIVNVASSDIKKPIKAEDSYGNNIMDKITSKSQSESDRDGWFSGTIGYGNTIDEIYKKGNHFILDFGDVRSANKLYLLFKVNELKGGKLPILVQTKDDKGKWVTRGSARHAEDRYGALDLTKNIDRESKHFQVKVIPTLNFIDWMGIATETQPCKVTKLELSKAEYTEAVSPDSSSVIPREARNPEDVTAILKSRDGSYQKFDYQDTAYLYFKIPAKDKDSKRDFVFAPVGYFETGGTPPEGAFIRPITAEKAQDFAQVSPAGGYANHYNITPIDIDEWNERYATKP